MTAYTK